MGGYCPTQLRLLALEIPCSILHERFRKLVGAAEAPGVRDESEGEEVWDLDGFPGIEEGEREEDGLFDSGKEGE